MLASVAWSMDDTSFMIIIIYTLILVILSAALALILYIGMRRFGFIWIYQDVFMMHNYDSHWEVLYG